MWVETFLQTQIKNNLKNLGTNPQTPMAKEEEE